MKFSAVQTRRFARQYKKLHENVVQDVDTAVDSVLESPLLGERKKGDLAQVWVVKFRSQGQLYLLGYTLDEQVRLVYLEAIGSHENFYLDMKH